MRKPREVITQKTCLTCGLCCVAPDDQDVFCDIMPEDVDRLGKKFVRLHVLNTSMMDRLTRIIDRRYVPWGAIKTRWLKARSGQFKGFEFKACVALRGSVFSRVQCSIYDKRPHVCHVAVKPGDRACRQIRRAAKENLNAEALRTKK